MERPRILICIIIILAVACGDFEYKYKEGSNANIDQDILVFKRDAADSVDSLGPPLCIPSNPCPDPEKEICVMDRPFASSSGQKSNFEVCTGQDKKLSAATPPFINHKDYIDKYCPSIYDQGGCGWCVPFSTELAVEALTCKSGKNEESASEPHLAYTMRSESLSDCKPGFMIDETFNTLQDNRIVPLKTWPFPIANGVVDLGKLASTIPNEQTLGAKGKFQITSWGEISDYDAEIVRGKIRDGYNVVIGFPIFWDHGWSCGVGDWTKKKGTNDKVGWGDAIVFDQTIGKILLFNGHTWLWDGYNWELSKTAVILQDRSGMAMAYDPKRKKTIMFGGNSAGKLVNDTREFNGNTWNQIKPVHSPSPRFGHAMAYDYVNEKVLLFGGSANGQMFDDTWEWDGKDWVELIPSDKPSERNYVAMAASETKKKIVLFGGWNGYDLFGDTWTWNGTKWTKMGPANSPSPRSDAGMTDGVLYVMLFGGQGNGCHSDLWEWRDDDNWHAVNPTNTPPNECFTPFQFLAFDNVRNQLVAPTFKGEVWEFGYSCGAVTYPTGSKVVGGYHAVALIGYNDAEGVFYFRNSWGKTWGEAGYGRMSYEFVNRCSIGGGYPIEKDW